MRKYWALFRVNFRAMLSNFSLGSNNKKKTKRAATGATALIFMAGLGLYISTIYSVTFSDILAPAGMIALMPVLIAFVSCIMSLMFTAFASSGIVFGNKDSDLMLSLPISAFSVMLSKIMALYIENLAFGIFMMTPAAIMYFIKGGEGGIGFVIRYILANIFLPLLPTIFALVIGFILALFQAKAGKNAILGNIVYMASFLALLYFVIKLQMVLPDLLNSSTEINSIFSTWLLPIGLFRDSIYGSYTALLALIAVLFIPFIALVYLMSKKYKKILTVLSSTKSKNDYKISSMKATGQLPALFKKEFGRYFGTPIYVFNTGFGVIMVIVGAVAAIINKNALTAVIMQMGDNAPIFMLLILAVSFMCVMTASSCISISLEGKTLWILKEAPIDIKFILIAKALVNMTLIWTIAVVGTPALWYAFNLSVWEALSLFLIAFAFGPFVAFSGLIINLFFPKMDSANDMLVVKQSTGAFLGVFSGFGVIGIGAGLSFLLKNTFTPVTIAFIFAAMLFLISALLWTFLSKKGSKMLQEIS